MYAFRKPFSVATYSGMEAFGIDYKTLLIIFQVFGYMLSKIIGIKVVSEAHKNRRAFLILVLILFGEASLFLFSITPIPFNIIFLFLNGLPLGMVWGLVFAYLEGRRLTEVLAAGLSVSFIVSSGFVKSIGKYVMTDWGVSELNMPFVTGALFLVPLVFFVWLLDHLPPPDEKDEKLRVKRIPLDKKSRLSMLKQFAFPLTILTIVYVVLAIYRELRDNFMADIWLAFGYGDIPSLFTLTEIPIAILVLIILGSVMLIKSNFTALISIHWIILMGAILLGGSSVLLQFQIISPTAWMIYIGMGLYMGYVPFNCILFDRSIAAFKLNGNSGFLIYIADSFGYMGSVLVLLYKNFGQANISWYNFIIFASYSFSGIIFLFTIISMVYFYRIKLNKIPRRN